MENGFPSPVVPLSRHTTASVLTLLAINEVAAVPSQCTSGEQRKDTPHRKPHRDMFGGGVAAGSTGSCDVPVAYPVAVAEAQEVRVPSIPIAVTQTSVVSPIGEAAYSCQVPLGEVRPFLPDSGGGENKRLLLMVDNSMSINFHNRTAFQDVVCPLARTIAKTFDASGTLINIGDRTRETAFDPSTVDSVITNFQSRPLEGSTNISGAVGLGIRTLYGYPDDTVLLIAFITDGDPTSGGTVDVCKKHMAELAKDCRRFSAVHSITVAINRLESWITYMTNCQTAEVPGFVSFHHARNMSRLPEIVDSIENSVGLVTNTAQLTVELPPGAFPFSVDTYMSKSRDQTRQTLSVVVRPEDTVATFAVLSQQPPAQFGMTTPFQQLDEPRPSIPQGDVVKASDAHLIARLRTTLESFRSSAATMSTIKKVVISNFKRTLFSDKEMQKIKKWAGDDRDGIIEFLRSKLEDSDPDQYVDCGDTDTAGGGLPVSSLPPPSVVTVKGDVATFVTHVVSGPPSAVPFGVLDLANLVAKETSISMTQGKHPKEDLRRLLETMVAYMSTIDEQMRGVVRTRKFSAMQTLVERVGKSTAEVPSWGGLTPEDFRAVIATLKQCVQMSTTVGAANIEFMSDISKKVGASGARKKTTARLAGMSERADTEISSQVKKLLPSCFAGLVADVSTFSGISTKDLRDTTDRKLTGFSPHGTTEEQLLSLLQSWPVVGLLAYSGASDSALGTRTTDPFSFIVQHLSPKFVDVGTFIAMSRSGATEFEVDGQMYNTFIPLLPSTEYSKYYEGPIFKCLMSLVFTGWTDHTAQDQRQWTSLLMNALMCIFTTKTQSFEDSGMIVRIVETLTYLHRSRASTTDATLSKYMKEGWGMDVHPLELLTMLLTTHTGWGVVSTALKQAGEERSFILTIMHFWMLRHARFIVGLPSHIRSSQFPKIPSDMPSSSNRVCYFATLEFLGSGPTSKTLRVVDAKHLRDVTTTVVLQMMHPTEGRISLPCGYDASAQEVSLHVPVSKFDGAISNCRIEMAGDDSDTVVHYALSITTDQLQHRLHSLSLPEIEEASEDGFIPLITDMPSSVESLETRVVNALMASKKGGNLSKWVKMLIFHSRSNKKGGCCDVLSFVGVLDMISRFVKSRTVEGVPVYSTKDPLSTWMNGGSDRRVQLVASIAEPDAAKFSVSLPATATRLFTAMFGEEHCAFECLALCAALDGYSTGAIRTAMQGISQKTTPPWWANPLGYLSTETLRVLRSVVASTVGHRKKVLRDAQSEAEKAAAMWKGVREKFATYTATHAALPLSPHQMATDDGRSPLPRNQCAGCGESFSLPLSGARSDYVASIHRSVTKSSYVFDGVIAKSKLHGALIAASAPISGDSRKKKFRIDGNGFQRLIKNCEDVGLISPGQKFFSEEDFINIYQERERAHKMMVHLSPLGCSISDSRARLSVPRLHVTAKVAFFATKTVQEFVYRVWSELNLDSYSPELQSRVRTELPEIHESMRKVRGMP